MLLNAILHYKRCSRITELGVAESAPRELRRRRTVYGEEFADWIGLFEWKIIFGHGERLMRGLSATG